MPHVDLSNRQWMGMLNPEQNERTHILLACAGFYLPTIPFSILQSIKFCRHLQKYGFRIFLCPNGDAHTMDLLVGMHAHIHWHINWIVHALDFVCSMRILLIHLVHTNRLWRAPESIKVKYIILVEHESNWYSLLE